MNPRIILSSKAPLRTCIRLLLLYLFFPEIIIASSTLRDSLLLQGQALEALNQAVKLLDERIVVLWRKEVENSLYRG